MNPSDWTQILACGLVLTLLAVQLGHVLELRRARLERAASRATKASSQHRRAVDRGKRDRTRFAATADQQARVERLTDTARVLFERQDQRLHELLKQIAALLAYIERRERGASVVEVRDAPPQLGTASTPTTDSWPYEEATQVSPQPAGGARWHRV